MNPADEIRQAAATLRELATKATSGPWRTVEADVMADVLTVKDLGVPVITSAEDEMTGVEIADARWIATMSPSVAEPLAETLESTYYAIENGRCTADRLAPVLRLARQINEATR